MPRDPGSRRWLRSCLIGAVAEAGCAGLAPGFPLDSLDMATIAGMDVLLRQMIPNKPSKPMKQRFLQRIAPPVIEALDAVRQERETVLKYSGSPAGEISPELQKQMDAISAKYGTRDIQELLKRVDVVPLDLFMAQASIESAWGTSLASRNCNNLFGVHASRGVSCGYQPLLAGYSDERGSIERYLLLLNTGAAFKGFRDERSRQRAQVGEEGKLDSNGLASELIHYSQRGGAYISEVDLVIRENHLDEIYNSVHSQSI